jgi:hypothetical protein
MMELINKILHAGLFLGMLLMYYRMFTTVSAKDMKKRIKKFSWRLLRLVMAVVMVFNFLSAVQDIIRPGFTPVWMHTVSLSGAVLCFIWAQLAHEWKLILNFKKEFHL